MSPEFAFAEFGTEVFHSEGKIIAGKTSRASWCEFPGKAVSDYYHEEHEGHEAEKCSAS